MLHRIKKKKRKKKTNTLFSESNIKYLGTFEKHENHISPLMWHQHNNKCVNSLNKIKISPSKNHILTFADMR